MCSSLLQVPQLLEVCGFQPILDLESLAGVVGEWRSGGQCGIVVMSVAIIIVMFDKFDLLTLSPWLTPSPALH